MATAPKDSADGGEADAVHRAIARAWRAYYEDPAGALDAAVRGYELGRSLDDAGLCARARALQGAVGLHRGDLHGALELAVEAQRHLGRATDSAARCEVAALRAHVSFFSGSYADALREAELAVRVADESAALEQPASFGMCACSSPRPRPDPQSDFSGAHRMRLRLP